MECRNCRNLSNPKTLREGEYPAVHCELGLWDKKGWTQWYSYGECQLNRGPVRRYGAACTQGQPKT